MKLAERKAAVEHLTAADAKLARLIERVGKVPPPPRKHFTIFYSLLRSIVYQQLAGAAASAILGRVHGCFPDCDFPTAEHIVLASDETLRAAGLSRNKLLSVRDLAARALDGTVPSARKAAYMSDEELIERLTTIRGIGRWTVEMLLIFRLGRPDILPVSDYGVRKGFMRTFKTKDLPTAQQMSRRAERWRPYRSVASWYLWRAAEE
jgi:3-methyladenine DNA glycosylase/8-oxoguanine DNA glycosylase